MSYAQSYTNLRFREHCSRHRPANNIDRYRLEELAALAPWIRSDGLLKMGEVIIEERVKELGYRRRGTKIEAAMRRFLTEINTKRAVVTQANPIRVAPYLK
jgi:hypothetical protein